MLCSVICTSTLVFFCAVPKFAISISVIWTLQIQVRTTMAAVQECSL